MARLDSDLHKMKKNNQKSETTRKGTKKQTGKPVNFRPRLEKEEMLRSALEATELNETDFMNELLDEIPITVRRILERRKIAEERFFHCGEPK